MQDAHAVVLGLPQHPAWVLVAIFDGHGGTDAAQFASTNFVDVLSKELKKAGDTGGTRAEPPPAVVKEALARAFLAVDARFARAVATGKLNDAGSTAVVGIITPTHVYLANAGDSRGMLLRGGHLVAVTRDHKPADAGERTRIEGAGSEVYIKCKGGPPRIDGNLAVSRGLGDMRFKDDPTLPPTQQAVTALPDVYDMPRDASADQLLVLACDGVWDVMSSKDGAKFLLQCLQEYTQSMQSSSGVHTGSRNSHSHSSGKHHTPVTEARTEYLSMRELAEWLIERGYAKGSTDNLSAIVVAFPAVLAALGRGQSPEEAATAAQGAFSSAAAAGTSTSAMTTMAGLGTTHTITYV